MKSEFNSSAVSSQLPLRLQDIDKRGIASQPTLWRWRQRGLKTHTVGRIVYVFPEDLAEFIRSHESVAYGKGASDV